MKHLALGVTLSLVDYPDLHPDFSVCVKYQFFQPIAASRFPLSTSRRYTQRPYCAPGFRSVTP